MSYPACRRPVLPLALGLLLLGGEATLPRACAQAEPVPFRQGTHAFRRILYDLVGGDNLQPIEASQLGKDPAHTLLIVLGETAVLDRVPDGLFQFIMRGGAALVATDRYVSPERLSLNFNLVITGKPVELQRADRQTGYRGMAECPLLRFPPQWAPAMFQGLQRVASNRPSHLARNLPGSPSLPGVAAFTGGCLVDGEPRLRGVLFAAGGELGTGPHKGRVLVMADHSVFINDMLSQSDNDNFDFALLCLEWLTDGGRRNRVLFVEEGLVQSQFDVAFKDVPPPPLPPLGVIVRAVDSGLRGLEEENAFDRMIQNRVDAVVPRQALQALGLLLTLGVVLYGLVRIGQGRHRTDPSAPLLEPALTKAAPARAVAAQRQQEMLAGGALWEPARALARHWLEDNFGPLLPLIEERALAGRRPLFTVKVTAGPWGRWVRSRQVGRLWQLAFGTPARRVTVREFAALKRRLAELTAAVAEGGLHFEVPAWGEGVRSRA
jgi:hypothetical protein